MCQRALQSVRLNVGEMQSKETAAVANPQTEGLWNLKPPRNKFVNLLAMKAQHCFLHQSRKSADPEKLLREQSAQTVTV